MNERSQTQKEIGFLDAVSEGLRKSLSFSGRCDRPSFWKFQLFLFAASFGLTGISSIIDSSAMELATKAIEISLLPASFSSFVRRANDSGTSVKRALAAIIALGLSSSFLGLFPEEIVIRIPLAAVAFVSAIDILRICFRRGIADDENEAEKA
jgi:uncharacterized membrane protein YhaH (DUF805 family)